MKIVEKLNQHNISKTQFANDFALSRPTLDDYILKYESHSTLPKEKYNIIFKALFKEDLDSEAFLNQYRHYKLMISRDRVLNISELDPNTTDDVTFIVSEIKKDANTQDKLLLKFLTSFIVNYKKGDSIAKNIILYTTYLNSSYNGEINDNQKKYLGNFYKLNRDYIDNPNSLDIREFEKLKLKKKEILINKELKTEEVEKKIYAVLREYVEKTLTDDPANEDVDSIVGKVLSKLKE